MTRHEVTRNGRDWQRLARRKRTRIESRLAQRDIGLSVLEPPTNCLNVDGRHVAARYDGGATVYELAAEFGCNRATVAERLKKNGLRMRGQSPLRADIDQMVEMYASGLPLARVSSEVGFSVNTVRAYLYNEGARLRDCHGR
jgi:AraC-like DNA-binding protein